jgi:uncharacterized cupin superfamily protein
MRTISIDQVAEINRQSPKGRFRSLRRDASAALGGETGPPRPFEVQWVSLPTGASLCPYHEHSAEWEHYIFVSGEGRVRHPGGVDTVHAGDHVLFAPGEAHQITNEAAEPLVYYVIANNVEGSDNCFYPDSGKWAMDFRKHDGIFRRVEADYFDGEE